MAIPSLLPIGGAALGVLASRAISGLSQGLSFQSLMAEPKKDPSTTSVIETQPILNLDEALPKFTRRLYERLHAEGVDLSQPFSLKYTASGSVVLDGDHPDRATIEDILSQDHQLALELKAIESAVTDHRDETSDPFGEFRLRFEDGIAVIQFE
jgi:hypothetical protein